MNSSSSSLPLLLLLLLLSPFTAAQPEFIVKTCSDAGNYTAGSAYRRNLNTLLTSIAADDRNTTGFYNQSSGQNPDRAYAIGLCRGDVVLSDCRGCIANATGRILEDCPTQKEAVGYYDFCILRYSNRSIYGSLAQNPVTYFLGNTNNASDPTRFNAALETLLTRLRGQVAAAGSSVKKFATGTERQGFVTIYALVQCTPDLSRQLCDDCLIEATGQIPGCCGGKIGGQILKPNCQLRFETSRF